LRTIAGGIPEITLSIPVGSDVVNPLLMIGMNLAKGMNLEKTVSRLGGVAGPGQGGNNTRCSFANLAHRSAHSCPQRLLRHSTGQPSTSPLAEDRRNSRLRLDERRLTKSEKAPRVIKYHTSIFAFSSKFYFHINILRLNYLNHF
jgi:hypothetical protein